MMRTTFAAREFTGEPLPDRVLYRILDNARFAPSGGNLSTMVVPQEAEVQKLLGIPDFCAVAAVLALGKPTRQITKLKRKSVDEIATWERFDGPAYTLADQPRGNPDGRETRGTG